jgi:hypothetical protein
MAKQFHEIRDPIHAFVRLTTDEREVLDSRPFQRLRYIHQLALTYLVYPGATHRRFEHSLGVMELATRIFDVVTHSANLTDEIRDMLPAVTDEYQRNYWRRVLRVAALCHDMGHLPFSHAAEKELLPGGWKHEQLTRAVIEDPGLGGILAEMKLQSLDVVKLALGPKETPDLHFSAWETILAEIIVGDAFGADRMDYLLRDSHHAGVAYGRFDHYRLIDTLRILPSAPPEAGPAESPPVSGKGAELSAAPSVEPALGIQEGGLHSAEALILARYFMFSQLYFHPVRRIYDIHLKDFLKQWLPNGQYSTAVAEHLKLTDSNVIAGILHVADSPQAPGHDPARRIAQRQHFRLIYQRHPDDVKITWEPGRQVSRAAIEEFGQENVRWDRQPPKEGDPVFPVQSKDGRIVSSAVISETLTRLPAASFDYVFVAPHFYKKALEWLAHNRKDIIKPEEPNPHGPVR